MTMENSDNRHLWILGAMTLAGAALRFFLIDKESLWMDEAYSVWFSQRPLGELWSQVPAYETHPPFYYTILKGWTFLFGQGEGALRALSAMAGVCAIPLIYALGATVAEGSNARQAGLASAGLYTLAPVQLLYAQEARPYGLLMLSASMAMAGAFWLLANPRRAAIPWLGFRGDGQPDRGAVLGWMGLILGVAASMWLHNLSTLLALALALTLAPALAHRTGYSGTFIRNAGMAAVAILLIWAPFIPWFLAQSSNVNTSFWMSRIDAGIIAQGMEHIFLDNISSWPARALVVVTFLLGLYTLARNEGPAPLLALAGIATVPLALVIAASYMVKPMFLPRTLLWVSIPFYVVSGAAFAADFGRAYKGALALLLLGALLAGDLEYYETHRKEPWRQLTAHIAKEAGNDDKVILLPNGLELPFNYYMSRFRPGLLATPLPRAFPAVGMERPYPSGNAAQPALTEEDRPLLDGVSCHFSDVWVILRLPHLFDPDKVALDKLIRECDVAESQRSNVLFFYRFTGKGEGSQG